MSEVMKKVEASWEAWLQEHKIEHDDSDGNPLAEEMVDLIHEYSKTAFVAGWVGGFHMGKETTTASHEKLERIKDELLGCEDARDFCLSVGKLLGVDLRS